MTLLPRGRVLAVAALAILIGACETSGPATRPEPAPGEATPSTEPFSSPPPAAGTTSPEVAGDVRAPYQEPARGEHAAMSGAGRGTGGTAAPAASAPGAAKAAVPPQSAAAASLRARHAALSERLEHSPFQQHIYLESVERSSGLQGDVYALLDHPFAGVRDAFAGPTHWCDVLILHINVKFCRASARDNRSTLSVALGRKYDQPLEDTYWLEFAFSAAAATADYMQIDLSASNGPLGTSNYHILLEAVGLEDGQAFMHLRYSYDYGVLGRLAMRGYLATSGRDKVGFTRIDDGTQQSPRYIGGVRGAIERNAMRYYLAISAYLDTRATPAPQRFEQSLRRWFAATERYPLQLHEVDRDTYLAMKRREYQRQQAPH